VAERPVVLPPVLEREVRYAGICQRAPGIRARVFALGRRDQIRAAPPSIAGNGQDLDSGGGGGRTQPGTASRRIAAAQLKRQAGKIRPAFLAGTLGAAASVASFGQNAPPSPCPHAEEPRVCSRVSSPPGLTRGSIMLRKNFFRRRWIAGSSPAMTDAGPPHPSRRAHARSLL